MVGQFEFLLVTRSGHSAGQRLHATVAFAPTGRSSYCGWEAVIWLSFICACLGSARSKELR